MSNLSGSVRDRHGKAMRGVRIVLAVVGIAVISFWMSLKILDYWEEQTRGSEITPRDVSDAVAFHVGTLVVREESNKMSLITAVGRRIPISEGTALSDRALVGSLTDIDIDAYGTTILKGWAIDDEVRKASSQVVATVADRIWVSGVPNEARPDIAVHGAGYLYSGFTISARGKSKAQLRDIRVFALMRGGTARELAYGPAVARGASSR